MQREYDELSGLRTSITSVIDDYYGWVRFLHIYCLGPLFIDANLLELVC